MKLQDMKGMFKGIARRNDMESRVEELGDGIPQEGDDNYEIYMEKTEGLRNLREVHEIERGVSGMISDVLERVNRTY
jgi:hypothetical protein